ncbi:MFS transporter [Ferrovibrio sp.]|uniref:MFS transporter n=1 Tax=Ferrovibrio sp. TaxID=1917215 RepID=UPI00311D450B
MWAAIRTSWPLFVGMIFLMVSNGLLGTVLTLRAGSLGFGETVIGLVQAAYPFGSLAGCLVAPRLVVRVGHVRVFAALASIASTAALLHLVTHDPWSWGAMRMLAGFCFAGLYVVAESWLNGRATNANRGSLLSIYFVIQTGGVAAGQSLLNLSSPEGILLLIVVSVLISLSLVPILISADASPPFVVPEWISLAELFRLSPMGLSGAFLNGVSQGAIYVVLALYGRAVGLQAGAIGALIGCATLGGMLMQFPLGRLSDRVDRRLVITGAAGLAIPVCLLLLPFDHADRADLPLLYAGITLIGGLTLPLYSICMAHMNDYLKPGQIVAASGTLTLVLGAGVTLGPVLGSLAVEQSGPAGLFTFLAIIQALTVATALFRLWHGQPRSATRGTASAMAPGSTACAAPLNPGAPDLAPRPAGP